MKITELFNLSGAEQWTSVSLKELEKVLNQINGEWSRYTNFVVFNMWPLERCLLAFVHVLFDKEQYACLMERVKMLVEKGQHPLFIRMKSVLRLVGDLPVFKYLIEQDAPFFIDIDYFHSFNSITDELWQYIIELHDASEFLTKKGLNVVSKITRYFVNIHGQYYNTSIGPSVRFGRILQLIAHRRSQEQRDMFEPYVLDILSVELAQDYPKLWTESIIELSCLGVIRISKLKPSIHRRRIAFTQNDYIAEFQIRQSFVEALVEQDAFLLN